MVPKEIAVELNLEVATVRRLQASVLERLRIGGGEKGLLRWMANAHDRWQREAAAVESEFAAT